MSTYEPNPGHKVQPEPGRFEWIDELRPNMPTIEILTRELTPELVSELFADWVQRTKAAISNREGKISMSEASELLALIRSVLDPLEEASKRRNECIPDILSLLSPIDDLTAGLELIVVGPRPRKTSKQRGDSRLTCKKGNGR